MTKLEQKLHELHLPDILKMQDGTPVTKENWQARRKELLAILQKEVYGQMPSAPKAVSVEEISPFVVPVVGANDRFRAAGKIDHRRYRLTATLEDGKSVSFPFDLLRATAAKKSPLIEYISFENLPNTYCPTEEIIDNGFALTHVYYNDIATDDNDFTNGIAPTLSPRTDVSAGKIALWAWALMRIRDYLETRDDIDQQNVAVAGHSRLGKTALLAGAMDERFRFVFANGSGCSGMAITRGKIGEAVADIYNRFPYWFCKQYGSYAGKHEEMPFDQHFLAACVAPRYLYDGCAVEDTWADPNSEYLCCKEITRVYKMLGKTGFVAPDALPNVKDRFAEGDIGFHVREYGHFLSRTDWNHFFAFMRDRL